MLIYWGIESIKFVDVWRYTSTEMTKSGASVVEVTGAHGGLCWVGIYQVQHGVLMKPEKNGRSKKFMTYVENKLKMFRHCFGTYLSVRLTFICKNNTPMCIKSVLVILTVLY